MKKFLISYNVNLFRDYLLDMYFVTDTLEEIQGQIDDHFRDCCPLVYENLIKNRQENPYTFKIYELKELKELLWLNMNLY
jgi:hypothetical protein